MTCIVALAGGVGGSRMVDGLAQAAGAEHVTAIVNTADDFEHLGLAISPDIDTVTYALAGLENPVLGWGRRDETWGFMDTLGQLGADTWFRLGDKDLAIHIERTRRLAGGESLSAITHSIARALGINTTILPMSDDPVRTLVDTDEGTLAFQHYFVRRRCEPRVHALRFAGAAEARILPAAMAALEAADLDAIVICPSNPFISIDPILALPGVRAQLVARRVPTVAVSPIIGGKALKGPAAKIMAELGAEPSALAVALRYRGLVDGLVIDTADAAQAPAIVAEGIAVHVTDAIMRDRPGRARLARETIAFARRLQA